MKSPPGLVGAGWDITLNYIQRDVNYSFKNETDDFYLLNLNGQSHKLVYTGSNRFHTKIESYLYIENRTDGWIVKDKSGRFYNFSTTISSNLHDYTWRWMLSEIKDTHENSIYYNYSINKTANDIGAVYPDTISYNNDKEREIRFILENTDRPDTRVIYTNGQKLKYAQRIGWINITAENQLVRTYKLTYENADTSALTLLTNITLYGNDGESSLPPTNFDYRDVKPGWSENTSMTLPDDFIFFDKINDGDWEYHDSGMRIFDRNKDGYPDLMRGYQDSPSITKTWILEPTGWTENGSYTSLLMVGTDGIDDGYRVVDVNHDGYPDQLKGRDSTLWCKRSTGLGFEEDGNWTPPTKFLDDQSDIGVRITDLNGDGWIDFVKRWENPDSTDEWGAWINNGSGFQSVEDFEPPEDFLRANEGDVGVRLANLNGDGLIDIIEFYTGACYSWLNNGSGWEENNAWSDCPTNFEQGLRLVDLNGDGLDDLIQGKYTDPMADTYTAHAWINTGNGWIQNDSWAPLVGFDYESGNGRYPNDFGTRLTDINGDGQVDIIQGFKNDSSNSIRRIWISNTTAPYLLVSVVNGQGGVTNISYVKSTSFDNTGSDSISDLGFNIWLMSSITRDNGMTGAHNVNSTVRFSYANGLFLQNESELRGFGYVLENWSDKYIKHWYYQDGARKSREYQTELYDSDDNPYQKTEYGWIFTDEGGYYVVLLENQTNYGYDGETASPKITRMEYFYDDYGNILQEKKLGERDSTGDEKYRYHDYSYNTTSWLLDKRYRQYLLDYDNSTVVRETFYYYDGHDYGTTPGRGDLTRIEFNISSSENPEKTFQYYSQGVLANETDAEGFTTRYEYDSTYTYPENITNALDQLIQKDLDLATGNVLWEKDPNGYYINYTYDAFGRKNLTIREYDSNSYPTEQIEYDFDGVAPEKKVVKKRESSGDSETLDAVTYTDGFGNDIQKVSEAEDDGEQIQLDIYYDEFGRVMKQSNPYYASSSSSYNTPNESVKYTRQYYDVLDRIIRTTKPDGNNISIDYAHWFVTWTDENGNQLKYEKDSFGRIIEVTENNGTHEYTTTYSYNPADQLLEVVDDHSNSLAYTYDLLGHKMGMDDPDLGVWSYQYDKNGNIVNQTDAVGNLVSFGYDEVRRIVNKTQGADTYTYTYDTITVGTLAEIETPDYTTQFEYDRRLRKTNEVLTIDAVDFETNYTYDSLDRLTSKQLFDGTLLANQYNPQGLLEKTNGFFDLDYNQLGQHTQRDYNNSLQTTLSYNLSNYRLTSIITGDDQELNFSYDAKGNILSITDDVNSKTETFTYDDLDRLLTAEKTDTYVLNYTYDSIGNILVIRGYDEIWFEYSGGSPVHSPGSYQMFSGFTGECAGIEPPVSGDWGISSDTRCEGNIIELEAGANTDVASGNVLTLDGVTLSLDSDGGDAIINVNGVLNLEDKRDDVTINMIL